MSDEEIIRGLIFDYQMNLDYIFRNNELIEKGETLDWITAIEKIAMEEENKDIVNALKNGTFREYHDTMCDTYSTRKEHYAKEYIRFATAAGIKIPEETCDLEYNDI